MQVSLCPGQTMIAGSCLFPAEDTFITIVDGTSNAVLAQDDDGCALQSTGTATSLGATATFSPSTADFVRAGAGILPLTLIAMCYQGVTCSAGVTWTIQGPPCSSVTKGL